MNLVDRVKNVIIAPKAEWAVIEAESSSIQSVYLEYLVILAAIPAIAGFIGMSLTGTSFWGVTVRTPIMLGMVHMVFGYVMTLVMVYVVAQIVNALAPNFQGEKNLGNAFKLVAFSMTPGMLAGAFGVLPGLAFLSLLAGLYGIYLLYLGVIPLLKVPQEKAVPYVAVVVLCIVVASLVVAALGNAVTGLIAGRAGMEFGLGAQAVAAPAVVSIATPKGTLQIDTRKLDVMNRRLEEIGQQSAAVDKPGDPATSVQLAAQALSAMAEAIGTQSVPAGDGH